MIGYTAKLLGVYFGYFFMIAVQKIDFVRGN